MTTAKHRSGRKTPILIGLSVSYQRENLLARGLGLEHLKELLIRLARPLLRQGANLAYGGHWKEAEDNFTFDLLRLISAEQEDTSAAEPDSDAPPLGRLYNHAAWPAYLEITPGIEAQWINCCRIVRISQQQAGIADADVAPDSEVKEETDRAVLNAAITLSAMRRISAEGSTISIPGRPSPETVPAVVARIALGGKVDGYSGLLPTWTPRAARSTPRSARHSRLRSPRTSSRSTRCSIRTSASTASWWLRSPGPWRAG